MVDLWAPAGENWPDLALLMSLLKGTSGMRQSFPPLEATLSFSSPKDAQKLLAKILSQRTHIANCQSQNSFFVHPNALDLYFLFFN